MRILVCLLCLLFTAAASAHDWSQFRGPRGASYSAQASLPADDSIADAVAWKKQLPGRAVSGPIVVRNRVIATASDGPKDEQLYVVCHDADTGEQLWQRKFWATGRTLHHPTSATAAPTPVSDGEHVFAFFSSNDLICLDLDGNLQWLRGLTADHPAAYNDTGMASSPLVSGDTVVVQVECFGDSFAAGLNKQTGETRWRIPRAATANWASPLLLNRPKGDLVLLQSSDRLSAHEPHTGKEVWSYLAKCDTIPSLTSVGDVLFLPAGGITALRVDGHSQPTLYWKENRLAPSNASPVVVGERLYVINGAGVLVCGDAQTGDVKWQARLTGSFWATPVVAGSHLYAVNQDGLLQIVRLPESEGKGEVVARYELGEGAFGSPAIGDGAMFVQSERHLWKIAK